MKLTEILKALDISKWSACWAYICDGWAGIAKLVCEAFTKLLRRCDPEKLKTYAEFAQKVATFIGGGVEIFCTDEGTRRAGLETAGAVALLAGQLSDGEYTVEELEQTMKNIDKCIDAWKGAGDEK